MFEMKPAAMLGPTSKPAGSLPHLDSREESKISVCIPQTRLDAYLYSLAGLGLGRAPSLKAAYIHMRPLCRDRSWEPASSPLSGIIKWG